MDINAIAKELDRMTNQCGLESRLPKNKAQQYEEWKIQPYPKAFGGYFLSDKNIRFKEETFFNKTTANKIISNKSQEKILEQLSGLQNNWDGYGAIVPDEVVKNNTIALVSILPLSISNNLKKENIVPTPYGTIVIDWEKDNNLVSVEVGDKEIGFFTEFAEGPNLSSEGVLFNKNELPLELAEAFKKLYS